MAVVPTVTGSIDSADLGRVLAHEHIFVVGEEYRQNYQSDWDEDAKVADAVTQLSELKSLGIDTILDPTVIGLGRYLPRVQRVAEQVDLNIVVATGIYTYNDVPFRFHYEGPGGMLGGLTLYALPAYYLPLFSLPLGAIALLLTLLFFRGEASDE